MLGISPRAGIGAPLGLLHIFHIRSPTDLTRLVAIAPEGVLLRRLQGSSAVDLRIRPQTSFHTPRVEPLAGIGLASDAHSALFNVSPALGSATCAGSPVCLAFGEPLDNSKATPVGGPVGGVHVFV